MADQPERRDNVLGQPGRRLSREAGDPTRLLQGEDPRTTYADDARHWIAVYRELLEFKERVIAVTHESLRALSESAREEVLDTDVPILESEAQRFRNRIAFWQRRLAELDR